MLTYVHSALPTGVTNGVANNLVNLRVSSHSSDPLKIVAVHGQYYEASGKERPLRQVSRVLPVASRASLILMDPHSRLPTSLSLSIFPLAASRLSSPTVSTPRTRWAKSV